MPGERKLPMRRACLSLLLATFLGAMSAHAQTYPSKPVRLVVPFPPGGSADMVARAVAMSLAKDLGQPIVVENKPGADGAIAGDAVAKAAPDGYTLLFATNTAMLAAPTMRKVAPYDPLADFTPISLVGRFGFFLFVHPGVPAANVPQLMAHIRANPGKVAYGSGNFSSIMAVAQWARLEKLDMLHVPYKGDAPLTIDLLAARVSMMVATPGSALPHVQAGKLRVLATMLPTRSALLPEVPTMAESGVAGLSITPWAAIFGPARMPRDVVERLSRSTQAVLASREVKEQLAKGAFEAESSTPAELSDYLKDQYRVWRQTVHDIGMVPD